MVVIAFETAAASHDKQWGATFEGCDVDIKEYVGIRESDGTEFLSNFYAITNKNGYKIYVGLGTATTAGLKNYERYTDEIAFTKDYAEKYHRAFEILTMVLRMFKRFDVFEEIGNYYTETADDEYYMLSITAKDIEELTLFIGNNDNNNDRIFSGSWGK
jgi:hypothetical protein